MKMILMLLFCLVGVTYQQRYVWPQQPAPSQAQYQPLFYANGVPAGYDILPQREQTDTAVEVDTKFLGNLIGGALVTYTSTVTSTVVSTYTTPLAVQCIASSEFVSTTACRRRRSLFRISDVINPDAPVVVEPSVFTTQPLEPVILSSQSEDFDGEDQSKAGVIPSLTSVVSVTYVTTSYSLVPLTVKTTVTVGASTGLLCLPSGYVVC